MDGTDLGHQKNENIEPTFYVATNKCGTVGYLWLYGVPFLFLMGYLTIFSF